MASAEQRSNTEKEEEYKIKKKAIEMLPDAEANILKLQVSTRGRQQDKKLPSQCVLPQYCANWL